MVYELVRKTLVLRAIDPLPEDVKRTVFKVLGDPHKGWPRSKMVDEVGHILRKMYLKMAYHADPTLKTSDRYIKAQDHTIAQFICRKK